jgi:hypothetical protein
MLGVVRYILHRYSAIVVLVLWRIEMCKEVKAEDVVVLSGHVHPPIQSLCRV